MTCACPPTAANGNVTLQTCSDPQRAVNTCWPGGSISSCKATGSVTGDSQFSYVSAQPGGKAEPCFLTSVCHTVSVPPSRRSCARPRGSRDCWQGDDGRTELRRLQGKPRCDRCGRGCGRCCWCPQQEACAAGRCPFGCAHQYGWGWTTLLGQPLALQQDRALTCLPRSVLLRHLFCCGFQEH